MKLILTAVLLTGLVHQATAQTWSLGSAWSAANGTGHLGNNNFNRGLAYSSISNQVFVATRSAAATGSIDVFDGTTGALLSGVSGVNGANLGIDPIGVGDDGTLYGLPLTTTLSTSSPLKVYSWTNWNSTPYSAYQSTNASDPVVTSFSGKRIGDTVAVTGSGANTLILAAVAPSCTNFVLLHTADGVNFSATVITNVPGLPQTGPPDGRTFVGITFYTNNTFLVQPCWSASSRNVFLVSYPANFASQTGVSGTILGNAAALTGLTSELLDYSPAGQMLAAAQAGTSAQAAVSIFNLTNFPTSAGQLATTNFTTPNDNLNATGAVALGGQGKTNYLYVLESNNGLQAYTINFTAGPIGPTITTQPAGVTGAFPPQTLTVSASGTAPLYYYWQVTNTASAGSFTNVPGAANTNFYTITVPSTNYYRVIVSDSVNSVTSTVAFVSLLTPVTSIVVTQLWTLPAGSRSYLAGSTYNTRGLAYDTNEVLNGTATLLVADHSNIYLLSATNGADLGSLNMAGLGTGGVNGWVVDQIGVADDGVLYSCNLTLTGPGFYIVRWPSISPGAAAGSYAWGPVDGTGADPSGTGDRWGDTMAVRGSGTGTEILLGSYAGTSVVLFTTTDGITFTPNLIPVTGTPAVPAGFCGLGIAFGAGDTFWCGHNYNLRHVSFDRGTWTGNVSETFIAGTERPNDLKGLGVDVAANILGGVCFSDTPNDLQLYELSGNTNPPALFNQAFFASNNLNSQGDAVTTLKGGKAFSLNVNNGIVALSYGVPTAPPVNITSVTNQPGTGVTINWNNCFNGHNYQVVYKNELTNGTWTPLGSPVTAVGPTASFTDTSPLSAARYYRVQSE